MRVILRNIEENGNLLPSAINVVNSIPIKYIYNKNYFLREPKIIILKSTDRVLKAFVDIIELNDTITNDFETKELETHPEFNRLSKSIIELLDAINSLIEDCLSIFKCTTPPSELTDKNKKRFVSQWLERSKHPTYLSFFKKVESYRNEITYYINNYKHQHGRIEIIPGNIENKNYTLGYTMKYIDKITDDVMEVLDLNKVKSISLDIKYNFYQFYNICELFSSSLIESINLYHNAKLDIQKVDIKLDELEFILSKINKDNLLVFPNNELFAPKVYIKHDEKSLSIHYPLGITNENSKFIIKAPIKGKSSPQFSVLLVPSDKVIEELKPFHDGQKQEGDKLTLTDAKDNFLKIFFEHQKLTDRQNEVYNYYELKYEDYFSIRSFSNILLPITFVGGMTADKLHIKIFDIDHAGIKMNKK